MKGKEDENGSLKENYYERESSPQEDLDLCPLLGVQKISR